MLQIDEIVVGVGITGDRVGRSGVARRQIGWRDHLRLDRRRQNAVPLSSSNWGAAYSARGILAPGVDVLGAVPGGGTARKTGTSFATPFVSGLVGLLASLQIEQGKKPDPRTIRATILKTATPCVPAGSDDCRRFLAGVLNVEAVMEAMARRDGAMTEEFARRGELGAATLSALDDEPLPAKVSWTPDLGPLAKV